LLDIKKLVKLGTVRRYRSQAIIYQEGDLGSEMFIILSGSVRVLISNANGQKVEIDYLKAEDIFGEMSLLEGLQRSSTVQALEETITVAVNASNFESVIYNEPSLALRLVTNLSERLKDQNVELAKYKDQVCSNSQPVVIDAALDVGPLIDTTQQTTTIVEIDEEHKLEDKPECDDFRKSIQYFEKYNKMAPSNHAAYLFDKKIQCPVCSQTIGVKHIRSSKLRLKQVELDYRQVYTDFDPLWYIVWVCPYCCYANFSVEFLRITDQERRRMKEFSSKAKNIFGPYVDGPLSLTQVLTGYYLMLYWFEQVKTHSLNLEKLGKLWLRLSWLFHDVQATEMFLAATKKALGYFINLLNDITVKTTIAQDQYLYLLVGELSFKIGQIDEARNYLRQSLVIKGGNIRMKEQAQTRIQDLKSLF